MTPITIEKSFREWTRLDLEDYIGLQFVEQLPALDNWLSREIEITEEEKKVLDKLSRKAKKLIDFWNEMELREKFILKLTDLVDFDDETKGISHFSERSLSFTFKQAPLTVKLSGFVDWMVAAGQRKPRCPFFFIHEYKAVDGQKQDGKGQLLAAMYVAQQINKKPKKITLFHPKPSIDIPIYGAYVVGKYWTFLALENNQYAISDSFDSTKISDLQVILQVLKAQKEMVFQYLGEQKTM